MWWSQSCQIENLKRARSDSKSRRIYKAACFCRSCGIVKKICTSLSIFFYWELVMRFSWCSPSKWCSRKSDHYSSQNLVLSLASLLKSGLVGPGGCQERFEIVCGGVLSSVLFLMSMRVKSPKRQLGLQNLEPLAAFAFCYRRGQLFPCRWYISTKIFQ